MAVSVTSRSLLQIFRRTLLNPNGIARRATKFTDSAGVAKEAKPKSDLLSNNQVLGTNYSQPVHESHPHLIASGEVTPLIHKDEFAERRSRLMEEILKQSDRTKANMILVPSASKLYMSGKIPFVFRQNSDFFYLTGCNEPEVVLALIQQPGSDSFESIIFMPRTDSHTEVWEGAKLNLEFCLNFLGIQQANYMSNLGPFLSSFVRENHLSGVQIWRDASQSCNILDDVISQVGGSVPVLDLVPLLHNLRLIKSKAEQELMRRTCSIISEAVTETMKVPKALVCESELWATVEYHSRMRGAQYLAYPPVVAGGSRANTIHYINNNQMIKDGEMVLMDAGCQYYGYTSDMTRCWPINGKFTSYQKEAYEAVLDVQLDLIRFCRERPPLDVLFQHMCRQLGKNLQQIGFGKAANTCVERAQMAYSVCPHHVSHYLGLDVHDTGKVPRNIPLQPGMVITIEPGLYVDLNRSVAPKEFHGLGLRIEDDILINDTDVEVLTQGCPKSVAEIENVMR